ncbi:hypothetical protein, partial [Acinetobacter sp. 226]|uniref:hypothetical protein n=1 Tax=Acinetobacter sp. 226 TaxID=3114699 RepID=UPI003A863D68
NCKSAYSKSGHFYFGETGHFYFGLTGRESENQYYVKGIPLSFQERVRERLISHLLLVQRLKLVHGLGSLTNPSQPPFSKGRSK